LRDVGKEIHRVITSYTWGGLEVSHPYILKINVDKIALGDSTDFQDAPVFGMAGIHVGILGAGMHAGPIIRLTESNGIICEVSSSFLWASLHRELNREFVAGASIGFIQVVFDRHYFFPIKAKFEVLKKIPINGGLYFGGSL
jgi:hypothetical protein